MCLENNGCIGDILKVILVLQEHAEHEEECLDTCDRGFLGNKTHKRIFNTRPVVLYTCCGNGVPWSMPTVREDINCAENTRQPDLCSNVFRIEKLDDGCATFRVLRKVRDGVEARHEDCEEYEATDSFFTITLECLCAIRCLKDTFVEGV